VKFNGPDVMGLLSIRQLTSLGIINLILKKTKLGPPPPLSTRDVVLYINIYCIFYCLYGKFSHKFISAEKKKSFIKMYTILRISSKK
jgi:hypothetical protein